MRTAKLKFIVLFTLFLVFTAACSKSEKEAQSVAGSFLNSYFSVDYEKAATYCTVELGQELRTSLMSIESLDKGVKDMIIKQTSGIKYNIKKVDKTYVKDSIVVVYEVKLPGYPDGSDNRLSLVRRDKEWKVATIGK
jgi:hypothetical protein